MCGAHLLARHAELVHRMAETVGVDLAAARAQGRLSAEGLREAVSACTGCAEPGACGRWLAEHEASGAEAPPDYCENAGLFAGLGRGGAP